MNITKNYRNHQISSIIALVISFLGIFGSLNLLFTRSTIAYSLTTSIPLFQIKIYIDQLGLLFLLIISTISFLSTLYGWTYMKQYAKEYNLGVFGFFYNCFILSMMLVVTAYSAIYFLFVWELMSLTSLFLVLFENRHKETVTSGTVYFVMTHIGTIFIMLAFAILYLYTGSFEFDIIHSRIGTLPAVAQSMVFLFALIGFGTKAGIIPVHIWLPRAHSSAPSHVSSLMSGVMIKLGLFMLIRMLFFILPLPQLWWGVMILIFGASSAVLGVLYALAEHDIKRLLAFHSIENIGIILLGIGSSLVFLSLDNPTVAALALTAGLFHIINHAAFKSLLFLGAGSVISQMHTRNIEEYGGLIKLMPYTAVFFLIGAIAISGLPPFNGFASEWLTYQALFQGINGTGIAVKSIFIAAIASLALTGGLAAACFVKAYGVTFLGRSRAVSTKNIQESDTLMRFAMGGLAALCLILGVGASFVSGQILHIISTIRLLHNQLIAPEFIQLQMPIIPLFLIGALAISSIFVYIVSKKQSVIRDITWNCGFGYITPRMEVTATGFSRSIISVFRAIFRPHAESDVEFINRSIPYITKSRTIHFSTVNIYEIYFYHPIERFLAICSEKIKSIQSGNVNLYIMYIFLALIGVLLWVRYS